MKSGEFSVKPGDVYGNLTVVGNVIRRVIYRVKVRCECGTEKMVYVQNLRGGDTKSCGCLHNKLLAQSKFTHGESGTPLYAVWMGMKARCLNPKTKSYHRYGGRGISVFAGWMIYENFRDWANLSGYRQSLQLDRIDNDGDYEPENCRWVTPKKNISNRNVTIRVTAFGETMALADWAEDARCSVGYETLWWRIHNGWDAEKAITTQLRAKR